MAVVGGRFRHAVRAGAAFDGAGSDVVVVRRFGVEGSGGGHGGGGHGGGGHGGGGVVAAAATFVTLVHHGPGED